MIFHAYLYINHSSFFGQRTGLSSATSAELKCCGNKTGFYSSMLEDI